MAATPVITVSDLRKRYGSVDALRGISLAVSPGEVFGVLGPNGAGKTTLIKSIVGSVRPTAGGVDVLGLNPATHAREVRRRIGYMPQAPALYDDLSARHNLQFFGRGHRVPDLERRIDETLELVGLTERQRDPVFGLSGGMKQRVSLACAVVHGPQILFLDEPTAGVDPRLRETFWKHFRALSARGVTLVISTHQMDEAMSCDRLAIVRGGELLACEPPQTLLARGRARVTIWRDDREPESTTVTADRQLAGVLHAHGLDGHVTRVDVERDSLETIVLDLIKSRDTGVRDAATGSPDARH